MTYAIARGHRRVVLLAPTVEIRGTAAEFRRIGVTVRSHDEILRALLEVAREPDSILIVSSDLDTLPLPLPDMLNLAVAMCGQDVILGLGTRENAAAIRIALKSRITEKVQLPLTPDRLQHALRRFPEVGTDHFEKITVGGLTVDSRRYEVFSHGVRIDVTPREFAMLNALTRAHPNLVTREQLAAEYNSVATDPYSAISVAINRIRNRLTQGGGTSPAIEVVRGVGYRLTC